MSHPTTRLLLLRCCVLQNQNKMTCKAKSPLPWCGEAPRQDTTCHMVRSHRTVQFSLHHRRTTGSSDHHLIAMKVFSLKNSLV